MKNLLSFCLSVIILFVFTAGEVSVKAIAGLETDVEISGEISVNCYYEAYWRFLNEAAKRFEQRYPYAKVNIIGFSTNTDSGRLADSSADDYAKAISDYITRVNVEMMSGGGGDIYAIDVLPVYKYADNGQFVDLREFMDSDPNFDYNDYHKSVFDAVMYRDGQYILPTEYDFNILSYDTRLLDKSAKDQFDSIGKYSYDRLFDIGADSFHMYDDSTAPIAMMKITGEYIMFNSQLNINFNVFADVGNRKASFADGRFAEILNKAREYGQQGYYGKLNNDGTVDFENMSPAEQQSYILGLMSVNDIYKQIPSFMLLSSLISEEQKMSGSMPGTAVKDYEIFGLLANINGDVPVDILYGYAMNENSKNKETAWEFLKFLISEDMQTIDLIGEFMPVNKNAFVTNAKTLIFNILGVDRLRTEPLPQFAVLSESQQTVLDRYLNYTEAFLPMLNTYINKDSIIRYMITSDAEKFFAGTNTADEVAAILQSRVDLYLRE